MLTLLSLTLTGFGLAATPLAPIGSGASLRTPAQRHFLRMKPPGSPPVYLLAVQQEGEQGRGLGFFRSEEALQTWRYDAPIQNDASHADRADLLAVGDDVALVYSFEDSQLSGSAAHDVYFQWWRWNAAQKDWLPSPRVIVFDATSDVTAYSRAELARDSEGRIWVQAFRLEPDGGSTAVLAVSVDRGATFQPQPELDRLPKRGGGRLIHLGKKLLFVYDCHDCGASARMRIRKDSAPLSSWEPIQNAFPDGIYHGAALSAVTDGRGSLHLFYKNHDEQLFYRHFDGTTFGPPTLIEEHRDWALQVASTRIGDEVRIFYNAPLTSSSYEIRMRTLHRGVLSAPTVLDDGPGFKGYLTAPERLPTSVHSTPCAYGQAPDAKSPGLATFVAPPSNPSSDDGRAPENPTPKPRKNPHAGDKPSPTPDMTTESDESFDGTEP